MDYAIACVLCGRDGGGVEQPGALRRRALRPSVQAGGRLYRRCTSKSRAEGFGAEVKRRIMLGTYALSSGYYDAYYLKALKVRRLIRQDFVAGVREGRLLMMPVSPTTAFQARREDG